MITLAKIETVSSSKSVFAKTTFTDSDINKPVLMVVDLMRMFLSTMNLNN